MSDTQKKISPPYATFGSFSNFINKLGETALPSRIDATLFGNASGTTSYSVIAAMKYLGLIDDNGTPLEPLRRLVDADEPNRKQLLSETIRAGYPTLFDGDIDLSTVTAGQFDEHIRETFDVQGSTVDKIAAFFIGAAKHTKIEISPHLKARKPIAASSTSRRSAKQRKGGTTDRGAGSEQNTPPPSPQAKPLEYQLIDLMSEPDIEEDVKASIWSLVQYLTARKAMKSSEAEPHSVADQET